MDAGSIIIFGAILVKLALLLTVVCLVAKFISTVFKLGALVVQDRQSRQTTFHYYDHPDRYYDYHSGQWVAK